MVKLSIKTLEGLKKLFLRHPTKSDRDIAKVSGISYTTISKYRKLYDEQVDQEFIAITAGKFISEFGKAIDYWKLQIDELEELKSRTKTVFKMGKNKKKYAEQVELEPMDILAICKQQAELRKYIIFLGSQGEVREVIKVMRSGKLPQLEAN